MKRLVLSLALLTGFAGQALAAEYTIDPNHTQVLFQYTHFGYSHITGRFNQVSGHFDFDPAQPTRSSIDVSLPIASISTGVDRLDTHLKSPDFFDAEKFPTATFKSTAVTAAGEGKLKVAGNLTIHGVTRPVVLDVTVNRVGEHPMAKVPAAGFDARVTIKRSDFGVAYLAPAVSDEVTLAITMEAHVAAPAAAK